MTQLAMRKRKTPMNMTVQVTVNQDTSAPPVFYRYMEDPVVYTVKPTKGPISGGTYVEVNGEHFDLASDGDILCRFNTTAVPATFVTSSLLQCTAPNHIEGYVDVEITMQQRRVKAVKIRHALTEYIDLISLYSNKYTLNPDVSNAFDRATEVE